MKSFTSGTLIEKGKGNLRKGIICGFIILSEVKYRYTICVDDDQQGFIFWPKVSFYTCVRFESVFYILTVLQVFVAFLFCALKQLPAKYTSPSSISPN